MCFRVWVSVERKRVMQEVETNAKGGGDWWLGARDCIRRAGYLLLQVGSRHFGGVMRWAAQCVRYELLSLEARSF